MGVPVERTTRSLGRAFARLGLLSSHVGARLTLDLTGLPPTPEEIDAFAQNPSDEMYEQVVDDLSSRPTFGEQRAHHWLDAVRYADTHGFHFDNYRSIWPYRDYVINSMLDALGGLNQLAQQALGDPVIAQRTAQYELAFRMQSSMPGLTDLSQESATTLALYGDQASVPGTFAANCISARRMLEKGVRFVQIYHRGWDAHYATPTNHTNQCHDIDQACFGLITDLQQRGLLEDTLVIWGGEFGRTVYCQGDLTREDYGRDHHPHCFTMWLAGGGARPGIVHGETDDFGFNVVSGEVPLRDLHATVLHLFGLDPQRLTYLHEGLDEKLVGVGAPANVVTELLA
jgi:hypothetical protein